MSRQSDPWVAYLTFGTSWSTQYYKNAPPYATKGVYPRHSHTNTGLRCVRRFL